MPSRRDQIAMTQEEIEAFLREPHFMSLSTIGKDGFPHVVAMLYGFFSDGSLGVWTYAKSQKVRNLERDNRIGCLIESGRAYHELKGIYIAGHGEIIRDADVVKEIGRSLYERYFSSEGSEPPAEFEHVARKRVAIKIHPSRISSWDHSKLGGAY